MKGFEKDKWNLRNLRSDWKVAVHKDFPFIKFNLRKMQKGSPGKYPTWLASVKSWNLKDKKVRGISVSYSKLTKDKIPEIFDRLMQLDSVKQAFLNLLFKS